MFPNTVSLLIYSCSEDVIVPRTPAGYVTSASSEKYLATDDELKEAKQFSKDIINWQVARSFAVKELKDNKDYDRWQNAVLSDRPIIIYDNAGAHFFTENVNWINGLIYIYHPLQE